MTEQNYTRIVCAHCHAPHEAKQRNRMYCSNACKLAAWKLKNPERHEQHMRKGAIQQSAKAKQLTASPQNQLKKSRKSLLSAIKALCRLRVYQADCITRRGELAVRPCQVCGADCGYSNGPGRKYCSSICRDNSEVARRNKKASKLKRRALKRGVECETFHPSEVFDRDGWICQMCGVSTPESLRGSYAPNAPELDHIYPISKGGAHTRANTQCSCRSCNQDKSDRTDYRVGSYQTCQMTTQETG